MSEPWADVVAAGARADLPDEAIAALPAIVERIASDGERAALFARLRGALLSSALDEALRTVREEALDERFGTADARAFYLALALSEIESAEARHRERGIDTAVSRATLADLGIWVRHFLLQTMSVGATIEILDWSQRYLRGELYRIGLLQFDLRPYVGSIRVRRHRETRELAIAWLEGGAEVALVDTLGERRDAALPWASDPDAWLTELEPGTPALDMHIPAGARLGVAEFASAIEAGYAFFGKLSPGVVPAGALGEAWLLDPQMDILLPKNAGLHAIRSECRLYPSALTEAKTIRRLFGPDIERAHLPFLPQERMTSLHRNVVAYLADPSRSLRARGGLVLREELTKIRARLEHSAS